MTRRRQALLALGLLLGLGGCSYAPTPAEPVVPERREGRERIIEPGASERAYQRTVRGEVLRVRTLGCGGMATGSGFLVDPTTVVTNRHVAEGYRSMSVNTWDGALIAVEEVRLSSTSDLAVLSLAQSLEGALPALERPPAAGSPVVAVGYPGGRHLTFTAATVVGVEDGGPLGVPGPVVRTTAALPPGSSGGPLLDPSGRVAGVVFARDLATGEGLALWVDEPADLLAEVDPTPPAC